MDAIEGPLKRRLQMELDKVDVEKLIADKIPDIEAHARQLQGLDPPEETILDEPRQDLNEDQDLGPFSESEEERGPS